jgi:thioredoxin reductase (NADPH)
MERETVKNTNHYDVIIVGQGAAAFSAALYAGRYKMSTLIIGEEFGGETATSNIIENYPGHPQIDGLDLMLNMQQQVEALDINIVDGRVDDIVREAGRTTVKAGDEIFRTGSVIFAVGRERRKLGLAREKELSGKGIAYCATCDAPLFRGKVVVVVGGGDSAIKGAIVLANYASKVYIIYRGSTFTRPEPINLKKLSEKPTVETLFDASVAELLGESLLQGVIIDQKGQGQSKLDVGGLFVEIGADPRTELAQTLGVELNDRGEIIVDKLMQTNVHGVFAAGDVTDGAGDLKQVITAAAQGVIAATSAYQHVVEHPDACEYHAVGYSFQ